MCVTQLKSNEVHTAVIKTDIDNTYFSYPHKNIQQIKNQGIFGKLTNGKRQPSIYR